MKIMQYIVAGLLGGLALAADASPEVTVRLSHEARSASAANRVDVDLENSSDRDVFVLGYHTVFEKPEGRTTGAWFHVKDAFGRDVPYIGRYVVSGAFTSESYIRVAPGDHLKGCVDLATEYELPPAGNVTVSTVVVVYHRVPGILDTGENEDVPATTVTSNSLTFPLVGGASRVMSPASTLKCSPEQLDSTRKAIVAAQGASLEAINFLGSLYFYDPIDPTDPVPPRMHMRPNFRYINWFGNWDESAPQIREPGWEYTDNNVIDQTVAAVYARLLFGASTVCDECAGYSHCLAHGRKDRSFTYAR